MRKTLCILCFFVMTTITACSDDDPSGGTLGPELGAFQTSGGYYTNRSLHGSIIHNGYIYVTGGSTSTFLTTIEYAGIGNDGTCTSFSDTTSIPEARGWHGCVAHNGYLYILGGVNPDGDLTNSVFFAPINGDGSLGAFQISTNSLNVKRGGFGIAVWEDRLYLMGGADNFTGTRSVEYAAFHPDGEVGPFIEQPSALNNFPTFNAGIAWNGYLYSLGGRETGSTSYRTVEYAKIQPDGSPGAFSLSTGLMTVPRELFAVAVYNGYLYAIGGNDAATGQTTNSIDYTRIDPTTGAPGAFTNTITSLPLNLSHHGAGIHDDRLYIIGGASGQKTIYSAAFLE